MKGHKICSAHHPGVVVLSDNNVLSYLISHPRQKSKQIFYRAEHETCLQFLKKKSGRMLEKAHFCGETPVLGVFMEFSYLGETLELFRDAL